MRCFRVTRAVMALAFAIAIFLPARALAQTADQDVNTDCTCDCQQTSTSEVRRFNIAVGSPTACTAAQCGVTEPANCPSVSLTTATYHDCTCHCCGQGICNTDGFTAYPFMAGSPEKCTPDACAGEFYQCPNSPNYGASTAATTSFAAATYADCTCGCKRSSSDALVYKMFFAGSPDKCTADQCSAKYYACPDSGSHNADGEVVATYFGVVPDNATAAAMPSASSGGVSVNSKSTELPTYAAALIAILVLGLVGTIVGIVVHRRVQKERGFRWVKFDENDGDKNPGADAGERV